MKITEQEAALLRAILDGKTLQYRPEGTGDWVDATSFYIDIVSLTSWTNEVRIKPETAIAES